MEGWSMRVVTILTVDNGKRYMLVDDTGDIIEPVARYLKFRDNTGTARNTLRTYCYHLKLYFEFLGQMDMKYTEIGIDGLAAFVRWLQSPYGKDNVLPITQTVSPRTAKSINQIITAVMNFCDYLSRHEQYESHLTDKLKKPMSVSRKSFKSFLHHANRNKQIQIKLLKLKEPKQKPKTLSKDKILALQNTCCNKRDQFLIRLLWESSMRIGEALALWLEDFEIDAAKIHIRDRGELSNDAEIKTVHSPRTIDVSIELMNEYMDYIAEYHTDEVDTNHVFVKLSGSNKNQPMEYQDVVSLFERLKAKAGFDATPHMLRHSSLTELRRSGWKPEHLMKRAGHAHVQTTLQMYIHPSDEDMRADWESAEEKMRLAKRENKVESV